MRLGSGVISDQARYSFTGIRQRDFRFDASTRMEFKPAGPGEEAGLTVIQNDRAAFLLTLTGDGRGNRLTLYQNLFEEKTLIAEAPYEGSVVYLRVTGTYLAYGFSFSADGNNWQSLGDEVDGRVLSPAVLGGFNYTGVYLGLYASANGETTQSHADFDFFRYRPAESSRDEWYPRQQGRH
jgi:alpha-N-arabinofuranosidase